jgi:hypothetical protein
MKIAIKIWFCLAAATLAASLSDIMVESASDRGWFGPGQFTDHSLWVIGPAVLTGIAFVLMHLCLRVREALSHDHKPTPNWLQLARDAVGRRVLIWTPLIFALQIAVLFAMETAEQVVVYGHTLGGALWLDGPVAISLLVNAAVCMLVTCAAVWLVRALADATVQFVKLVLLFATLRERGIGSRYLAYRPKVTFAQSTRAFCRIGERAPPFLTA